MAKKNTVPARALTVEQRRTSLCEALRYAEQALDSVVELIADRRVGLAQKPGMGVDNERRVRDAFATARVASISQLNARARTGTATRVMRSSVADATTIGRQLDSVPQS